MTAVHVDAERAPSTSRAVACSSARSRDAPSSSAGRAACPSTRRSTTSGPTATAASGSRTVKRLYRARPGRAALRARRRGPSGIERDRAAGVRRPGRAARADRRRAWRRATSGVAPDRAPGGASGRDGARGHRGSRGLALGGSARGRPRAAARPRTDHELVRARTASRTTSSGPSRGRRRGRGPARSGSARSRVSTASIRRPARSGVFGESDGLGGNTVVNALASAEDGSVWAGSWPGGRDAHLAGRPAPALSAPRTRRPNSSAWRPSTCAPTGEVWVGAVNGLYRLPAGSRTATGSSASRSAATSPTTCAGFAEDPAGILYAASKQGILRVNGPVPAPLHASATACARTTCPRSRSRPTEAS